jgi:Holliday junction resolvase RusA-like endonuclease
VFAESPLQQTSIRIELAGEPRGKGRPRFSRKNGIAYTPAPTRNYEAALRYAAQGAMAGRAPLDGPLSVWVTAFMPIPTSWSKRRQQQAAARQFQHTSRPDFDNILKSLDAINGVVWRDDSQIWELRFNRFYDERPRLCVVVEPRAVFGTPCNCGMTLPRAIGGGI